ncbi:guanine deaminase [Mortierella sp. GBAus27b]|nr:hypothetical protein BGX31_004953 [Mortierella sp. GBA43]KAI8353909.1 guanine deaminase [Mortierella sp. GBAus27b]
MSSFAETTSTAFYGTIIHSVSIREIEFIKDGLLFVDTFGRITQLLKDVHKDQLESKLEGVPKDKVVVLDKHQFIIPGFVDTHIHASQYSYCGNGHDIPLLDWLDTLTFPHESKFEDPSHARQVYLKSVARSLRNGTTSACWFATIHLEGTKELVKVIQEQGQRAYVGKVNMNRASFEPLVETTESSIADTRAFIEYVHATNGSVSSTGTKPLVTPIITPRFAISCTSDLLTELGKLAEEYNLPIQTHLCETPVEITSTMKLFKDSPNYTAIYADHQLLNHRSIMAHCVHMKDEEWALMKHANAGVSHCANSNFNIKSGMAHVRRMLDLDIKVGLGTDVAGGYSSSILDAFRCSRLCSIARNPEQSLTIPELFYLATMGGARVMGLEDTIGNFEVGKEFDAILVNMATKGSPVDIFPHDTTLSMFEKYLFVGDDRNNEKVYVRGQEVRIPPS